MHVGKILVNTLEKCAQWCNEIQNCRFFEWNEDVSFCRGYSEKCGNTSDSSANLYDMNACFNFDAPNKFKDNGISLIFKIIVIILNLSFLMQSSFCWKIML